MRKVIFLPKAEKQLRKLTRKNLTLAGAFAKCIQEIKENPFREPKVGDLQGVWGHGFRLNKVEYRIAYIIADDRILVFIIGVGTHEGFWKEIKNYRPRLLKK